MNIEDISIGQAGVDWQNCLQHWAWILIINPDFNILLVNKFGEIFVSSDDGSVWFLSTSNASYEKVADSIEEFETDLTNKDRFDYYFMPQVVRMLEDELGKIDEHQCYGFHVPCVFEECSFDSDNFKIIEIEAYLIGLGDMLGRLKDTTNGKKVSFNVVA